MLKKLICGLTLAFLLCSCTCSPVIKESKSTQAIPNVSILFPHRVKHPDKLKFSPLEVKFPQPQRMQLANGLILYFLEDHELPLVNITLLLKSGSVYDPPDKLGLANLTTALMRSGGTHTKSAETIDEILESMAATLTVDTDYESIDLSMSLLSSDLTQGLELLSEILQQPVFNREKLGLKKNRILEHIRRENDNSGRIASRLFRKLIYPHHPYGRRISGTPETIKTIKRTDLINFHKQHFRPHRMWLGITGDFQRAKLLEVIHQTLGQWQPPRNTIKIPPELTRQYNKQIVLVPRKKAQSSIVLGHIGVERTHPDYFPIMLMNSILGGGSLTSRLGHRIREEAGLAYGIYSHFTMPRDLGMFMVKTNTKNKSVAQAIALILEEIEKIRSDPVLNQELNNTKDGIINSFIFKFEHPAQIVNRAIRIELLGLPRDYLETYKDKIMAVTKKDIQRMAQKYLRPDGIKIVVVGNDKEFDKSLDIFGPVERRLSQ